MFIKKIKLDGYKRFKSLTIDLGDSPKRIVALVGPNGCGKSSVFDGILFHSNAYNMIGNKGSKDFWKSRACLTPVGKATLTPENFLFLTPGMS